LVPYLCLILAVEALLPRSFVTSQKIIQAYGLRNEGGWFTVKGSGFMIKDDGRMNNLGIFWSAVALKYTWN
jgi:hypothetical protein